MPTDRPGASACVRKIHRRHERQRLTQSTVVDVAGVSIVVAASSVVAASTSDSFQIRNQTRVKRTDLVMRLYTTFDSLEFQRGFHTVYWADFPDYDSAMAITGGERQVWRYLLQLLRPGRGAAAPAPDRLRHGRRSARQLHAAAVGEGCPGHSRGARTIRPEAVRALRVPVRGGEPAGRAGAARLEGRRDEPRRSSATPDSPRAAAAMELATMRPEGFEPSASRSGGARSIP